MNIARLGWLPVVLLGSSGFADAATAAADVNQPAKVVVSTRGLDMSTSAGVRKARERVRRAAEQVCGDYPQTGVLPPAAVSRCRTIAAREANVRIVELASRQGRRGMMLADADKRAR